MKIRVRLSLLFILCSTMSLLLCGFLLLRSSEKSMIRSVEDNAASELAMLNTSFSSAVSKVLDEGSSDAVRRSMNCTSSQCIPIRKRCFLLFLLYRAAHAGAGRGQRVCAYKMTSAQLVLRSLLVSTHTKYWLWIQADTLTAILVSANHNRVPIALPTSFHRSDLSNVGNTVDLIFPAVLPCDLPREHNTIVPEVCINSHIHLCQFSIRNCLPHKAPPYHEGNCSEL